MSRFAITGARGFLGWHLRSALQEKGISTDIVPMGEAFNLSTATVPY